MTTRVGRLFGALVLSLLATVPAGAQSLPQLFDASSTRAGTSAVGTLRARSAQADLAVIRDLADRAIDAGERTRFIVNLFSDREFEAEAISAERRASGGTTLYVRVIGVELGSGVFTIESGVLTASVDVPGGSFLITPQADGSYRVAETSPDLFPPEAEPRLVPGAPPTTQDLIDAFAPDVPTDSGRLIDVMVVWTPAAQTAAGGAAQIASVAQQAIDQANLAYLNSGVAQRLRLVYAINVAYTERCGTGSSMFGCALDDLSNGAIPNVFTLRDTYGADLVALFVKDDPSICGLAWLPMSVSSGNSGQGFSVIAQGCAAGNKSFAHELGHNMGAHHDPYVAPENGAFAYSHGKSFIGTTSGTSWRTVMAYNNECAATVGGCTRLTYFSNPNVKYTDSNAMGDASLRNNALTLNKTAKAVAGYRPTAASWPVTALYADVPVGNASFGYVQFMGQAAYTSGCAPNLYCPSSSITRRQMAVFLERVKKSANYAPPPATGIFSDVPASSQFAGFVEQLYADGITSGCATGQFCPDIPVTRAQMAVFILRARCGAAYIPATPVSQTFADVPLSHQFAAYIQKLYSLGITAGCTVSPLNYCPNQAVTRAQMATFIERGYPFGYPSETCTP